MAWDRCARCTQRRWRCITFHVHGQPDFGGMERGLGIPVCAIPSALAWVPDLSADATLSALTLSTPGLFLLPFATGTYDVLGGIWSPRLPASP